MSARQLIFTLALFGVFSAPAAASARAQDAPSPDAPPVTMAACPLISMLYLCALSIAVTPEDSGVA